MAPLTIRPPSDDRARIVAAVPDLLVKLYDLPAASTIALPTGVEIRRALPPEKHVVIEWVRRTFGDAWASECEVAFGGHPISCFVAVAVGADGIVGFACYDATAKGFFGPASPRARAGTG